MTKVRRTTAVAVLLTLGTVPAVAVPFAGPAQAAGVIRYTYIDLGNLGSTGKSGSSQAHRVNAAGQVVGYTDVASGPSAHAFRWQDGTMTDLGTYYTSRYTLSDAAGINAQGDAVGHGNVNSTEPSHALLFRNGKITDLGTGLGTGSGSYARDINDSGTVAGGRFTKAGAPKRAAVWRNGEIIDLGTLGGKDPYQYGTDSEAFAVNNRGVVVGAAMPRNGHPLHAFLWDGTRMRDLGTLGGNNEATRAFDVNDQSQVTGESPTAEGRLHAFLWHRDVLQDLGVPAGFTSSTGTGINIHGQVVGVAGTARYFLDPEARHRAVVSVGGTMTELQPLVDNLPPGLTLGGATSINDSGAIVGWSCRGECWLDDRRVYGNAFMLVPQTS
jgi:probable HAF family extracellular repeat protein